jgi:hypothetical protein
MTSHGIITWHHMAGAREVSSQAETQEGVGSLADRSTHYMYIVIIIIIVINVL